MLRSKSLKIASIFAYLLIAINTISGFILGPTVLSKVGSNVYGVYTTVNSLVSTLMIADLGVSQTLIRFVADYRANNKSISEISKFCKTIKRINYILVLLAIIAGIFVLTFIPIIYRDSFSHNEIETAKTLLLLYMVSIIATLLSNYYSGVIAGYGYYAFINITKTISVILKLVLSIGSVLLFGNIYIVVTVNVGISILIYCFDMIFYNKVIHIKFDSGYADLPVVKALALYTLLIFIQTIVDQVNSNLDNIIIGAIVGAAAVTVYSFGLTIFHMFQQLSTSISQMLIPYMADIVASGARHEEIENHLIRIGKIQFVIVGGIYFGFISFGKLFIELWLGSQYEQVWIVAVILMSGGIFPLIQNGAIALLKAKNLMGFRTITLFVSAFSNAILTIFLVNKFGFVYASVGTALGFIFINTIVMDIYYYKKLGLNMSRVLWNILHRALFIDVICALFALLPQVIFPDLIVLIKFLFCALLFVIIYCPCVLFIVLKKEERDYLFGRLIKR